MEDNRIVSDIQELKREGMTWTEIGEALGFTRDAVRSRYRRHMKQGGATVTREKDSEEDARLIFDDRKIPEDINWRELFDLAEQSQDINERLSDTQRVATVHIKTNRPIALVHTGDWHLGDGATDHRLWKRDIEFILGNKDVYMSVYGDSYQNARNFKVLSAVLGQVLSPAQQIAMIRNIVNELEEKQKLVAWLGGNHDIDFDERILGESVQKYFLNTMSAPRLINRGLLKLYVGDQLYTILMFHKSRFRSFMRATHGNYREYQLSYPADIVAGAHDHQPSMECIEHYSLARESGDSFGGEVWLIKVGTYPDSEYGWRFFHNGGPANPTTVLFPDRRKVVGFRRSEDAVRFMNAS
jgi:hypothetical protein